MPKSSPGTIHVFEFLNLDQLGEVRGLCPIFGSDRFLKLKALHHLARLLGGDDDEWSRVDLDGDNCEWRDVNDELASRSLFGGSGPKMVVIDNADKFVTNFRSELEDVQAKPPASAVLVLLVDKWLATTRLYKQANESGLQIDCNPPSPPNSRSKKPDDRAIAEWMTQYAEREYGLKLKKSAAQIVLELSDYQFGKIDQDLAKLSLYADQDLTPNAVREIVGGWPQQTMWEAIDAALNGDAAKAIDLMDRFLKSGEAPIALFAQTSWAMRQMADAAERITRDVRNRRRPDIRRSLSEAGVGKWNLNKAEQQLKQLGSPRVRYFYKWLVETDQALKGSHSQDDRARLVLETLFVKMSEELSPRATAGSR